MKMLRSFLVTLVLIPLLAMGGQTVNTGNHRKVFSGGCTSELPTAVSGLILWVSADCYTHSGTCASMPSGSLASTSWYDQSGSGNTWAASGAGCTGSLAAINGLPAATFDGASCHFDASGSVTLASNFFSAFVVANGSSTSIGGTTGDAPQYVIATNGAMYINAAGNFYIGEGTLTSTTGWHEYDAEYQQGTASLIYHLDGVVSPTSLGTPVSFTTTANRLGARNGPTEFLNGSLAEAFAYNVRVSPTDTTKLQCYLHNKYGL